MTDDLLKYSHFPFGGDPRLCIGELFARTEVTLVLATVAQRFRVELLEGQSVTPEPSITLRPKKGMKMTLHER